MQRQPTKTSFIRAVLPEAYFTVKARVKPLSGERLLCSLFLVILLLTLGLFGFLFHFYYIVDTQTEVIITKAILPGYTCESVSGLPPRTLTANCRDANGQPADCLFSFDGFGGAFVADSVPSRQGFTSISYEAVAFEPTFQSCLDSFFADHCGVPSNPQDLTVAQLAYTAGDGIFISPVIGSDGTVYVGSRDNNLHAVNPADGSARWSYMAGSTINSPPTIGPDGTIYLGSFDRKVHALNPFDGTPRWTYTAGNGIRPSPTVAPDGAVVYAGSADHVLHAIDSSDGSEKWTYMTGGDLRSPAVVGPDGTVYISSRDFRLHAVHALNGTMKWSHLTGGPIDTSPVIGSDGTIYVASRDFTLYALDPANGAEKWNYTTGDNLEAEPVLGPDGTIYLGSYDHKLHAINPADGTAKWTYTTGDILDSSPVLGADGTIYVSSYDDTLHAVNTLDGSEKWTYTTGGNLPSSPVITSATTIVVGSQDLKLYAVNLANGTEKWTYSTGGGLSASPALGADGTIFLGSADRKLHIIIPHFYEQPAYCYVSAITQPAATISPAMAFAATASSCEAAYRSTYCDPSSARALDLRAQFCAAFEYLPPYSCTRERSRGLIESLSLSFSFAELAYLVLLFISAQFLWKRFQRGAGMTAQQPPQHRNDLAIATNRDNNKLTWNPTYASQTDKAFNDDDDDYMHFA